MTKEKLDELLNHELSLHTAGPEGICTWCWNEIEDRWEFIIDRMRTKELERFLVTQINRYLATYDIIKNTNGDRKIRCVGPELYQSKLYIEGNGNYRLNAIKDYPISIDSEGAGLYVSASSGTSINCNGISRLLKVDDYTNKLIQTFKAEHQSKIERLLSEIGKEEDEFSNRMDRLRINKII
jgi:hypothetical protein